MLITGKQFVENGDTESYVVSSIPSGYTLSNVELPESWKGISAGVISAGSQSFVFGVDIGSGTIVITYTNGTYFQFAYLDVYSGACRMGEEITTSAILVPYPPYIPIIPPCDDATDCPSPKIDCGFTLDVFADVANPTDALKNDKSDFYGMQYIGSPVISNITLVLQKNNNPCGCDWVDKHTFIDNTYGNYFAFGMSNNFSPILFTDEYNNKYTGLFLEWVKILVAFGAGQYRMKIIYTSAIGLPDIIDYDIRKFCLHQWNCHIIDGTVRIETLNVGLRGTMHNKRLQIDYQNGWRGQIRFKGIFYEVKPNYNKEYNQYGDSEYNAWKPVINELIPKFTLDIKPSPGWVDWILSNNILLADETLVTDNNAVNRKKFIQTPVSNESGIETKDEDFTNPLAWSQIQFSYGQNNLRRRN